MDKFFEMIGFVLVYHGEEQDYQFDLRRLLWPCFTFAVFYLFFWKKSFQNTTLVKQLKAQSETEAGEDDKPYKPIDLNIPSLNGWMSCLYRKLTRSIFGQNFLLHFIKRQAGFDLFLYLDIPEDPTFYPVTSSGDGKDVANEKEVDLWSLIAPSEETGSFHFNTISDYVHAYRNHITTPLDVAKNVIAAIIDSESRTPKLRIIIESHEDDILNQANKSTSRWKSNNPLSVFDGVPVAVKDEIFVAGYPCRGGTPIKKYEKIIESEGYMLTKLRSGGAIIIGMANMHQLGIGVTGINTSKLHGTARTPYNTKYPCGGSSGGSAAAVAAGICPVALGTDGGGSIRIPSSVNGIVGSKVSYGRISATGMYGTCCSVGHAGPLCATTRDAAIAYGLLAGRDPNYDIGMSQPLPCLNTFESVDLTGITIGIDWSYFNHCNPEIASVCKKAVEYLVNTRGAKVMDISIPELEESSKAHAITILSEMYASDPEIYYKYHDEVNNDTEINIALATAFSYREYYVAQKQRTRAMTILKRLFSNMDCIITPACGDFVPELSADNLKYGDSDLNRTSAIMRFSSLGNFAGNPSISVPVGYSKKEGLPIGLLIQTSWWKEDLMFRIAHATEGFCDIRRPQVFYDLIDGLQKK